MLEAINAATDKLTQASHKLAEAMYKSAGPTPGADRGSGRRRGSAPGGDGAQAAGRSRKTTSWTPSSWTSTTRSKLIVS